MRSRGAADEAMRPEAPPTDGRPIKIASIVDEQARECVGGVAARANG